MAASTHKFLAFIKPQRRSDRSNGSLPLNAGTLAAVLARRFCHALAEETAGLTPGSWRLVQTIAQRMGIPFDDASSIADECVRREWADHRQHSVSLREKGRLVAADVRKSIVSPATPTVAGRCA
jgi:hypothetical protein